MLHQRCTCGGTGSDENYRKGAYPLDRCTRLRLAYGNLHTMGDDDDGTERSKALSTLKL